MMNYVVCSIAAQDDLAAPSVFCCRPLIFYLGCELGALLKHAALLAVGFRAHSHGEYTYYTYGLPATKSTAARHG
jgi:hypothetical protein